MKDQNPASVIVLLALVRGTRGLGVARGRAIGHHAEDKEDQ